MSHHDIADTPLTLVAIDPSDPVVRDEGTVVVLRGTIEHAEGGEDDVHVVADHRLAQDLLNALAWEGEVWAAAPDYAIIPVRA